MTNLNEDISFDHLKYDQSFRSKGLDPAYSQMTYDENLPHQLGQMSPDYYQVLTTTLDYSKQDGCLNVICNLHIDDASQVQSKMWKSASVFDIQIAGAPAGIKGSENNNMIRH